jgi:hypothetical protein
MTAPARPVHRRLTAGTLPDGSQPPSLACHVGDLPERLDVPGSRRIFTVDD